MVCLTCIMKWLAQYAQLTSIISYSYCKKEGKRKGKKKKKGSIASSHTSLAKTCHMPD